MSLSNGSLLNFIDVSTMPLSPNPFLAPTLAESPDSGISSVESFVSLLNHYTHYTTVSGPIRKERKKRIKEDYCKLCKTNIAQGGRLSQGPARHIHQYHMKMARFFCPHCSYKSDYDKDHVATHIKRMHQGLEGKIRLTTDPANAERFKMLKNRCFSASEEKQNVEVKSNCSGSPPPLPFSIESILAPISNKEEISPPAPLMFFLFLLNW